MKFILLVLFLYLGRAFVFTKNKSQTERFPLSCVPFLNYKIPMPIQESSYQEVEFIFDAPARPSLPPILLIHGAYNNAFIWRYNFLPYFVSQGHPVYAIHLKNQQGVGSFKTLFSYSLAAYTRRLEKLVKMIGEKPILVGHSMGGLLVQRYLSKYPDAALGACLLASLPVFGMKNTLWGMIKKPSILLKYMVLTLAPGLTRFGAPPRGLLSSRVHDTENLSQFQDSIQRESGIALAGCLFPRINANNVQRVPLQIYGGMLDNLALAKDVEKTGQIYGIEAKVYPEAAHFLMMEPEWKEIADRIGLMAKSIYQPET